MKILYAFQGTGNGHLARAQEIIPILRKYAEVDTLMSGHQSQLKSDFKLNFQFKGISLLYDKSGGLSYYRTFRDNQFLRAIRDSRSLKLDQYDLIINDFEPITAWACKGKSYPMIEVSHQASMKFKETPKPSRGDFLGEWVLNNYAPSKQKIGFHFESYHPLIKKPVIRKKIRSLQPTREPHYVVYLPSFSDENLVSILKQIPVNWKVFSKYSKLYQTFGNVEIYPIDEVQFLHFFETCTGILCNAGFETPAEALYMGKKLFVIPIHNQYEQECNACALDLLGIMNSKKLIVDDLEKWISNDEFLEVHYPDDTENIFLNEVLPFARH